MTSTVTYLCNDNTIWHIGLHHSIGLVPHIKPEEASVGRCTCCLFVTPHKARCAHMTDNSSLLLFDNKPKDPTMKTEKKHVLFKLWNACHLQKAWIEWSNWASTTVLLTHPCCQCVFTYFGDEWRHLPFPAGWKSVTSGCDGMSSNCLNYNPRTI